MWHKKYANQALHMQILHCTAQSLNCKTDFAQAQNTHKIWTRRPLSLRRLRFGGQRIRVYLAVLALLLYVFTKISVEQRLSYHRSCFIFLIHRISLSLWLGQKCDLEEKISRSSFISSSGRSLCWSNLHHKINWLWRWIRFQFSRKTVKSRTRPSKQCKSFICSDPCTRTLIYDGTGSI